MEYCAFVEPQQGARYADIRAFAQAAERLGFDGFFRSDHYLPIGEGTGSGTTDAWTTLAGVARDTERVRLGTLVSSVTYRVPGILAIQVAQVDEMSGGRVELGLGTGWYQAEHEAYGIPFPDRRFDLLDEQLQVVTGLLATPYEQRFDFAGEHYRLTGAPGAASTAQARIPIIVGGTGPKRTPELVARYASEYNVFRGYTESRERFGVVRAAAEAIDRDPASVRYTIAMQVLAGRDDAEYARRAAHVGFDPAEALADEGIAAGTPAQIIDHVARLAELGTARVYLQFWDLHDLEHLELVGSEILPHLPR